MSRFQATELVNFRKAEIFVMSYWCVFFYQSSGLIVKKNSYPEKAWSVFFSAYFPTSSKYFINNIQLSTQSFFVWVVIIFGFKTGNTEENLAKSFWHPEEDAGQERGLSVSPSCNHQSARAAGAETTCNDCGGSRATQTV